MKNAKTEEVTSSELLFVVTGAPNDEEKSFRVPQHSLF